MFNPTASLGLLNWSFQIDRKDHFYSISHKKEIDQRVTTEQIGAKWGILVSLPTFWHHLPTALTDRSLREWFSTHSMIIIELRCRLGGDMKAFGSFMQCPTPASRSLFCSLPPSFKKSPRTSKPLLTSRPLSAGSSSGSFFQEPPSARSIARAGWSCPRTAVRTSASAERSSSPVAAPALKSGSQNGGSATVAMRRTPLPVSPIKSVSNSSLALNFQEPQSSPRIAHQLSTTQRTK